MSAAGEAGTAVRRRRTGLVIGLAIGAGLIGLVLANAHLVYVAVTSQPGCVDHLKERGDADGGSAFRAAQPSC